jgi:hypothetical protein
MMARLLTKLVINEVSSVTKGAGKDCRIVLMKRDDGLSDGAARYRDLFLQIFKSGEENDPVINDTTYDDPQRSNTVSDDDKVTAHVKALAALMVKAEPGLDEAHAMYRLLHTPRGRLLWQHPFAKTEKDPSMSRTEEMVEMKKFVSSTPGAMNSIAKRVISEGSTSLTEIEYTDLWKAEAGSNAAFAKEFSGPRTIKHEAYDAVYNLTFAKAGYPNLMSVEPVSVEVGSTVTADDSKKAYDQMMAMARRQQETSPELSVQQLFARVMEQNPDLAAKAHRRPTASSPSYDAEAGYR